MQASTFQKTKTKPKHILNVLNLHENQTWGHWLSQTTLSLMVSHVPLEYICSHMCIVGCLHVGYSRFLCHDSKL